MIVKEWKSVVGGASPMEVWLNKLRHIRRFLKGWAKKSKWKVQKRKRETVKYH
jgi:hypothetical protein